METGITLHRVYLSLGSNLGDRFAYLKKAISDIEENIGEVRLKSSVYETEPWEMEPGPDFYNAVIMVLTSFSPFDLLDTIGSIEKAAGRDKSFSGEYLSRTLDIDILFYDDIIINTEYLVIPHPHIANRNFILYPLTEISPLLIHPVNGKKMAELKKDCSDINTVKRLHAI